ncbi:MAG: hypothetical protein AAGG72_10070, partial [Pseudomonadota bacterium]
GSIDEIVAEAVSSSAKRQLRVSVQPFFASECFVPRLEDFTARHPGIEIFVDTSTKLENVIRLTPTCQSGCSARSQDRWFRSDYSPCA